MTIWKFPLVLTDVQTVMMPEFGQILTAQMQNGSGLCLWAFVNPESPLQPRTIVVLGTGNPAPENPGKYISTVQMQGGALVWHIFERV